MGSWASSHGFLGELLHWLGGYIQFHRSYQLPRLSLGCHFCVFSVFAALGPLVCRYVCSWLTYVCFFRVLGLLFGFYVSAQQGLVLPLAVLPAALPHLAVTLHSVAAPPCGSQAPVSGWHPVGSIWCSISCKGLLGRLGGVILLSHYNPVFVCLPVSWLFNSLRPVIS